MEKLSNFPAHHVGIAAAVAVAGSANAAIDERRPCSRLLQTAVMTSETETRHEREPETFQGAVPLDARRADSRAHPRRGTARHSSAA